MTFSLHFCPGLTFVDNAVVLQRFYPCSQIVGGMGKTVQTIWPTLSESQWQTERLYCIQMLLFVIDTDLK
jgi:hypothetical protein